MDTDLPVSRHFFKVMMPGFLAKLVLPPVFCKRFGVKKWSEATLTSCKGTWKVKIGECGEEKLCFGAGWHEFSRSHDLDVGDFAVFEHRGSMRFHVSIFDPSCCEKEFPEAAFGEKRKRSYSPHESPPSPRNHRIKRETPHEETAPSNPTFTSTMGSCWPYISIPEDFAKLNGLTKNSRVVLRDEKKKLWPVDLSFDQEPCSSSWELKRRVRMKGKWLDFSKAKRLRNGDKCVFVVNQPIGSTVVMDVTVNPLPK